MRAVSQGGITVSAAAKQHVVPRKTLDDRIKGRVEHGTNPGPSTVLTAEEEVRWLPIYSIWPSAASL